jgi:hypothetical protein
VDSQQAEVRQDTKKSLLEKTQGEKCDTGPQMWAGCIRAGIYLDQLSDCRLITNDATSLM